MAEVSVQQAILETLTGLREEVTHLKSDVHYLIEAVEDTRLTTEEKKLLDGCITRAKAGTGSGFVSHEKLKKELGL